MDRCVSNYLNQCWLLISDVLLHLPESNVTASTQAKQLFSCNGFEIHSFKFIRIKFPPHIPCASGFNMPLFSICLFGTARFCAAIISVIIRFVIAYYKFGVLAVVLVHDADIHPASYGVSSLSLQSEHKVLDFSFVFCSIFCYIRTQYIQSIKYSAIHFWEVHGGECVG